MKLINQQFKKKLIQTNLFIKVSYLTIVDTAKVYTLMPTTMFTKVNGSMINDQVRDIINKLLIRMATIPMSIMVCC